MMESKPFFKVGLKIKNSSGETVPCTTLSPNPYEPLIKTTSLKPLSVSNEKATPEAVSYTHLTLPTT